MKFAAYLRASTDAQGDSYDTQRLMLAEYCQRTGNTITLERVDEATSGSVPVSKRPAAADLLAMVAQKRRPFDAILVVRKDRLFRDLSDELDTMRYLQLHRCPLYTPTGEIDRNTPEGELMSNLLGSIAQFERKLTGQRIREHNQARAMQGKSPTGRLPLGLAWDKAAKTVIVTDRAPDVTTLMQLYLDAAGNVNRAARRAAAMGIRSANGTPIGSQAYYRLLAQPIYRGRVKFGGREYDAPDLPRIVPATLTEQVDVYLVRERSRAPRTIGSPHCYSGRLFCAACGDVFTARLSYTAREQYHGWACRNIALGLCHSRKVTERMIDTLTGEVIAQLLAQLVATTPLPPPNRATPTRQRDALARQRARWAEMYADGLIDRPTLHQHLTRIDAALHAIEAPAPVLTLPTREIAEEWLPVIAAGWSTIPHDARRQLLVLLDARLIVAAPRDSALRTIELHSSATPAPLTASVRHRYRNMGV